MPRGASIRGSFRVVALLLVAVIFGIGSFSAAAQVHGVPPSVTSIQFHVLPFLPNARPSVTSLGPYSASNPSPFPQPYGIPRNLCPWGCRHKGGFGYNYGSYYTPVYAAVPYYYDSTGASPYLYSGPPPEQTLHVVVDLPPSRRAGLPDYDDDAVAPPPSAVTAHQSEPPSPFEPTVLVFRDGHQQEVSNYAIMGQTLYVFSNRTQKIGLSDLDVPGTIKLNDDRGVDFHLPSPKAG